MKTERELIEDLAQNFATFRAANDERLKQLAVKGQVDAQLEEKVSRIQAALDKSEEDLAKRIDSIERRAQMDPRGAGGADNSAADIALLSLLSSKPANAEILSAYNHAFSAFLRGGVEQLPPQIRADLTTGVDKSGGYFVRPDMSGRIVTREFETSPMRAIASAQTISSDRLVGPYDRDEADAGWVGDTASREATTDTPEVGEYEIPVHEQYAQPMARQSFLDDAAIDVEGWLVGKASDKLVRTENTGFVTGTGVKQPRGVTTYTTAATDDDSRTWGQMEHVVTGSAAAFASTNPGDCLLALEGKFKPRYLQNLQFAMRKSTRATVRQFKDGQGNYLWQPDFQRGGAGTLIGYPIAILADMPAIAANALAVAMGDFKAGYQIVDRAGITLVRDNLTKKGWVKFYMTKRVGGAVIDFDAIKFVKMST